jgi:hypothetical protein
VVLNYASYTRGEPLDVHVNKKVSVNAGPDIKFYKKLNSMKVPGHNVAGSLNAKRLTEQRLAFYTY